MPVVQNTCQAFNNHFTQSYGQYHIHKKSKAVEHVYNAAENHAQETDARTMMADALQGLEDATIEDR